MMSKQTDPSRTAGKQRAIAARSQGSRHGPITRLMSPGDLGELAKPFVFLDWFESDRVEGKGFPPHPHSGIATLTTFLEGRMTYADTTGKAGSLWDGSVEWMRAGGGVWHAGVPARGEAMRGYQLWLALPPELELSRAESRYMEPSEIQYAGPARVLLGNYEGKVSPIGLPMEMTYLHVQLADEERWTFEPPAGQEVTWLAINRGRLHFGDEVLQGEMVVFGEGAEAIELVADGAAEFVIGSAAKHPYPLVTGYYSVHTNAEALVAGERNILEIGTEATVKALQAAAQHGRVRSDNAA